MATSMSKVVCEKERGELKHPSTHREKKEKSISKVVASEIDRPKPESVMILGFGAT